MLTFVAFFIESRDALASEIVTEANDKCFPSTACGATAVDVTATAVKTRFVFPLQACKLYKLARVLVAHSKSPFSSEETVS